MVAHGKRVILWETLLTHKTERALSVRVGRAGALWSGFTI